MGKRRRLMAIKTFAAKITEVVSSLGLAPRDL